MKLTRKEILSVPNIMGYFRILLIPVFMYFYFTAQELCDYYVVAVIVIVSSVTDLFDGVIARKFDMVTELGKFLDPVADKLTHFALVICLSSRYHLLYIVLVLMIIKEGFMGVMGLITIKRKGKKLDGAMWYGKLCTGTLFVTMALLLLFPELNLIIVNVLICICLCTMLFALAMYIPVFIHMNQNK